MATGFSCVAILYHVNPCRLIQEATVKLGTDAIRIVTSNPADCLALTGKGHIREGMDADLLIINSNDHSLKAVFAMGRKMVENDVALVKGTFE